ncbi:MAG: hypothetical protein Q8869_01315, partial [Candidatus Phytoplasma australasiaticum]|nr:hypothetical protein [Candidatus Phytoplasma australasiaticum]
MLAPEWSDDFAFGGGADDESSRVFPPSPERQLARAARLAATTHLSDTVSAADAPVRNRFVIDQSAPLRLLDRRTLAENEGRARPTKGGLSVPEYKDPNAVLADVNGRKKDATLHNGLANAAHHQHRLKDDIWDVVDPVALFG